MIDDTRDESNVSQRIDLIARTYWTGIAALEKMGPWDLLFLDHDLNSFEPGPTLERLGRERTGYDVICFLEENPQFLPKEIRCISSNPAGRKRIEMVIQKLYEEKT